MKTKHLFLTLLSIVSFLFTTQNLPAQSTQKGKSTVTFYVDDMNCKNCQAKIEKNIAFEKGVTDLKCNLDEKTVEVTYKTNKTSPENLKKGFDKLGMPAVEADSVKVAKPE